MCKNVLPESIEMHRIYAGPMETKALDPLELKLQMITRFLLSVGKQTMVFNKSSKCL